MTQLRHYDNLGTARFVTVSCYHRYRLFSNAVVIRLFLEELDQIRSRYDLRILGYVVMPEHVHVVVWPLDGLAFGRVVGELKSRSARAILAHLRTESTRPLDRLSVTRDGEKRTVFWQRRCYDHNCRTPEAVREKINYCHMNPVKRGLVRSPCDWRWSSFNWYEGKRDVPLDVDEWEL
ncbi:MAG: transposase [candidate division Zixibacteria bacterium]|nr:transposase [candidate division Zixibacteria bacterium]